MFVMRRQHPVTQFLAGALMGAALLAWASPACAQSLRVGAVVVSESNCKFDTPNLALAFGNLDSAATAPAVASVGGRVQCNGGKSKTVTLALTLGAGTYDSGAGSRRMRHASEATEFLSYGLSISPAAATIPKNGTLDFTVDGTVAASQYQNAMAGNYLDAVMITVAP